jgi:L-ascorbate metabolism protein UlaG (beta-lactamase superfamily)
MSTRVRWLGHACLLFESDGRQILVDPFLTENPAAASTADAVSPEFILVSHGHADHLGDTGRG